MDWLSQLFGGGGMFPSTPTAMGPTGPGGASLYPTPPISTAPLAAASPGPSPIPAAPSGGFAGPGGPSIGESLTPTPAEDTGVPIPRPRPVPQASPTAQASTAPNPSSTDALGRLSGALRGVAAPPRPDVVKPSTPHGPPVQHIQGGNVQALLQMLYPNLAVPRAVGPTLGSALGIGRY